VTEPKVYTTAIIAAVPSQDDPVHQVVAEDAHVTLQFLGETADLSDKQITEIKQTLEMLASVVYPFQADISGTAELGPDKAQVLIVQSALLTKIRETLGMSDAVSTAVASVDQFPNWIPHLTLAYEGEMPDVSAFQSVEIGSIELWLAEEHFTYALTQPKPVTAAGEKIFEEGLHPRGADGRFIEKFGVIKYLTNLGWKYGKVEGIYADHHTGAIKLTITPSDLSGKTSGASVVLSPKQVYKAPTAKAHLTIDTVGVQKVGGQAGSNPGGLYNIPKTGATEDEYLSGAVDKFYVKTPKTTSHGNNEALANVLYEEAGVPVPEVDFTGGKLYSKVVAGQQDMAQQLNNGVDRSGPPQLRRGRLAGQPRRVRHELRQRHHRRARRALAHRQRRGPALPRDGSQEDRLRLPGHRAGQLPPGQEGQDLRPGDDQGPGDRRRRARAGHLPRPDR
jgi:2'-5' RNA ligase